MTPSSAKAKGRRGQKLLLDMLIEKLGIDPADAESRSSGANGEDLILSAAARRLFPYSPECKAVERLNVYAAYDQAKSNAKGHEPLVFMKRNRKRPLIAVDAEHFLELLARLK